MPATPELVTHALDLLPEAVDLRRRLHRRPEVGLHLPITQETVLEAIDGLGLTVSTGSQLSSVTAVLDTGRPGRTVLLRGDMDALPMHEDTGLDFASLDDEAMHACGHDAHVAMLAGAAHLLHERKSELTGKVVFMFQPGEEGHHGARFMIDEGVLDVAGPVDAAFAIHQIPLLPAGMIATKGGPMMASADVMRFTVIGRGGHASAPFDCLDPIPIACEIVTAIQSLVTRKVSVFDPAVVTVAHIKAGTTNNVIPESAYVEGTIRTLSAANRKRVQDELKRLAEGIGAAHGAEVQFEIVPGFPVTVNDDSFAAWTRRVAADVLGAGNVAELPTPVMGAEDFSYVLERVQGAMVFLGTRPDLPAGEKVPSIHSNRMMLDESAMATGIAMYAAVALAADEAPARS